MSSSCIRHVTTSTSTRASKCQRRLLPHRAHRLRKEHGSRKGGALWRAHESWESWKGNKRSVSRGATPTAGGVYTLSDTLPRRTSDLIKGADPPGSLIRNTERRLRSIMGSMINSSTIGRPRQQSSILHGTTTTNHVVRPRSVRTRRRHH
jgi:hypothetical protein